EQSHFLLSVLLLVLIFSKYKLVVLFQSFFQMLASLFLLQSLTHAFGRKSDLTLSHIFQWCHLSLLLSYISLLRAGHIASPPHQTYRVLSSHVVDLIIRQDKHSPSKSLLLNGSILAWYIVLQSPLHAVP